MAKILKGDEFKKRLNLQDRIESDLPSSFGGATEVGGVIDREVLDASGRARQIIEEAKGDAARIKAEAKEVLAQVQAEMERSKKEGYDLGYQEGLQQGLEMLQRVKELRQKLFDDNEREMVKLVFEIAEKIIGREFRENDNAIMNVIRLAISDAVIAGLLFMVPTFFGGMWYGPLFGVVQNLVDPRMRAMAVAIMLFFVNLIGFGGITAVGEISEALLPTLGSMEALRRALLVMVGVQAVAALVIGSAALTVRSDMKKAAA